VSRLHCKPFASESSVKVESVLEALLTVEIVAVEDISSNEELFRVPLSLVLCSSTCQIPSIDLDSIQLPDKKRTEVFRSILCLLREKARGSESRWGPYIATLPTSFDTPIFWSENEIRELQGCYIADQIGKAEMDALFKQHLVPVIRSALSEFGFVPETDDAEIIHTCHVAGSTFMAYAFDINEDPDSSMADDDEDKNEEDGDEPGYTALVPPADALNADEDHNAQMHFSDGHLIMESIKSISKGTEILNTYGPLDRAGALRRYGYITEGYKVNDIVLIKATTMIKEAMDMYELEDQYVRKWVQKELYIDTENGEPLENELARLVADFDFELERAQAESLNQAQMDEEFLLKRLIPKDRRSRYEAESGPWWMEWMRRSVEAKLKEYPTTLDEDKELLESRMMALRRRMAVEIRIGDKEILGSVKKQMDELLDASANGTDKKRKRP
jgi:hypothetical protein